MDLDNIKIKNIKIDKSKKRFIISSYTLGTQVNLNFLKAIKAYCKMNQAQLLLFPLKNGRNIDVDINLINECFILSDSLLNENIKLLGLFNKGTSYSQPSGLGRISNRGVSSITGGNVISIKYVPTVKGKLPHFISTTGSISVLEKNKGLKVKNNYLAEIDHKLGAAIVELEDNTFFHHRHVEFDESTKSFTDLGVSYSEKNIKNNFPKALVLGDWHSGQTDKNAVNVWKDLTKKLKVDTWVLHDFFDGTSINHHEQFNTTKRAQKANLGLLNLSDELDYCAKDLAFISSIVNNVVVVKSNHDEFLNRYLNEMRYKDEPNNLATALELHLGYVRDNIDPLKYWFKLKGVTPKNVKFLERDESYKIGGIELSAHGDRGSNGMKRGSGKTFEEAYGACVVGHSHTPQIFREVYTVGTTTSPFPDYGDGPNSWLVTSCLVYSNGTRQLLNIINNKVTTKKF